MLELDEREGIPALDIRVAVEIRLRNGDYAISSGVEYTARSGTRCIESSCESVLERDVLQAFTRYVHAPSPTLAALTVDTVMRETTEARRKVKENMAITVE